VQAGHPPQHAVRDFFTYGKSNQPKSPAREIHAHHLNVIGIAG